MTLINLFRRYKRWNPVHATYGAFWGFGVGLGCGVGWGPGFGPEVIGYVGAGCGVGFSVGVTLIGVGIGLPSDGLSCVPFDAAMFAGHGIVRFATQCLVPALSSAATYGRQQAIALRNRNPHAALSGSEPNTPGAGKLGHISLALIGFDQLRGGLDELRKKANTAAAPRTKRRVKLSPERISELNSRPSKTSESFDPLNLGTSTSSTSHILADINSRF
eukprot:TRINITY_DN7089_c0_g1_i1.p1 TRINITY_DN7089_c0_g1~~TRINITY_DN7089_c0_g1_i1.p1  ORF type:complete len:218 (-),score=28.93 TRINITY_DN7089_c0_g1_i1:494-1147(-)